MQNIWLKLKRSAPAAFRCWWPEIIICALLGTVVACASFHFSGLSSPAILDGIWFQADPVRVFGDMTDRFGNHYRTKVHPLFVLLTHPPITLLRVLTGVSALTAARLFIAFLAGIWIALVFSLLRALGCRRADATIFAILGCASATTLFWTGVTETYVLGSISILVGVLAVNLSLSLSPFKNFLDDDHQRVYSERYGYKLDGGIAGHRCLLSLEAGLSGDRDGVLHRYDFVGRAKAYLPAMRVLFRR
jgi:hypothetical protein